MSVALRQAFTASFHTFLWRAIHIVSSQDAGNRLREHEILWELIRRHCWEKGHFGLGVEVLRINQAELQLSGGKGDDNSGCLSGSLIVASDSSYFVSDDPISGTVVYGAEIQAIIKRVGFAPFFPKTKPRVEEKSLPESPLRLKKQNLGVIIVFGRVRVPDEFLHDAPAQFRHFETIVLE